MFELNAGGIAMARHERENLDADNSGRRTMLRIVQHGGAVLLSLVIVAVMAHSFGVSIT